jgi:hypothetical protein
VRFLPALVIVLVVATVAACGGTSPNYAGMSADEAAAETLNAVADDAKQPGNPLHGLDLRLERLVRGKHKGKDAWVVVFNLGQGARACVWTWADQRVVAVTYNYFVDKCTQKVLRAEPDIVAP